MAKFDLKFIDCCENGDFIKVSTLETKDKEVKNLINISGYCGPNNFEIWLDKSTAIKFAKTLRTEINKITESEVGNG